MSWWSIDRDYILILAKNSPMYVQVIMQINTTGSDHSNEIKNAYEALSL